MVSNSSTSNINLILSFLTYSRIDEVPLSYINNPRWLKLFRPPFDTECQSDLSIKAMVDSENVMRLDERGPLHP